ncbi:hypothetical protein ACFWU5_27095 [Nocardia sp. NPDC058640]|uniref:hypothetical protein n=1 Tax=Nocardia sp. NPDC058640 TaxID=3346571 RepID=UPI00364A100A
MSTITENARSTTEDNLWATLNATETPTTAAELATAAGIGASTARKILARWGTEGSVTRHEGDDNPRAAVRWSITPDTTTAPSNAAPEPGDSKDEAAEQEPVVAAEPAEPDPTPVSEEVPGVDAEPAEAPAPEPAADDKPTHLPSGGLRGMVEDHLRDHPSESFSPHQIGKALGRSSGAVHNALVKLTDTGIATRTCEAPKKFALAEREHHTPESPVGPAVQP